MEEETEPVVIEIKKKAPKKVSNPYMFFLKTVSRDLRVANPHLKSNEIFALIGATWNSMSNDEKLPYMEMTENDKVRY